jgi:hypothetical protein
MNNAFVGSFARKNAQGTSIGKAATAKSIAMPIA